MIKRIKPYGKRIPRYPGDDPGRWNEAKGKVLLLLYWRYRSGKSHPVGISDIHELTGVGYRTLATSLPKWHRWNYIRRKLISRKILDFELRGEKVYGYTIAAKGIRWIEEWAQYYLPIQRYRHEIDQWQDSRREKWE